MFCIIMLFQVDPTDGALKTAFLEDPFGNFKTPKGYILIWGQIEARGQIKLLLETTTKG